MKNLMLFIKDYLNIKKLKGLMKTFVAPLVVISICVVSKIVFRTNYNLSSICEYSINILGILLGFLISTIAIIATSGNDKIERTKYSDIKVTSNGKHKYLFDELVAEIIWCVLWSAISILLIYIFFSVSNHKFISSIMVIFMVAYCICASIGMVMDLYQVFSAKKH